MEKKIKPFLKYIGYLFATIIVFLIIIPPFECVYHYYYPLFGRYIDCSNNSMSIFWTAQTALATITMAIVTLTAVRYAKKAYDESIKARKENTFNAMFTTLIAKQLELFREVPNNRRCFIQDVNPFKDFVLYIESVLNSKPEYTKNITVIWNNYYEQELSAASEFSRCFKYVYNEINTVRKVNLDEEKNRYYCGLIQSSMTKDELFCYLINLLVIFDEPGVSVEKKAEYEELQKFILKNHFFEDLCRGRDRHKHPKILDALLQNGNTLSTMGRIIDKSWI